jgi:signal transduction histidine kinase/ligand-binding sensor domain-containing protein
VRHTFHRLGLAFLVFGASLCFAASSSVAGEADDNHARWQLRTFNAVDGLAHNIVRDVIQDRAGQYWFATMGGVTRYDSARSRFKSWHFSTDRREVMSIVEGMDGSIWIGTQRGGIARFHEAGWQWHDTSNGVPSDEITALMVDRLGGIWATLTPGGLARFSNGTWRIFGPKDGLSAGEIGRCAQSPDSAIFCGTYGRPVLQIWEGKRWRQLRVAPLEKRTFYVHEIAFLNNGDLWLATKGVGVIEGKKIGDGFKWQVHDHTTGVASDRVGAIFVDEKSQKGETATGTIWAATPAGVSFRPLHGSGGGPRWRTLTRKDGLGGNHVFGISKARDGAIWFATLGGGATRYAPSRWTLGPRTVGPSSAERNTSVEIAGEKINLARANSTTSTKDGTVYFALGKKIGRLEHRGGSWLEGLKERPYALRWHQNALWAATTTGIAKLHDGRWQRVFAPAKDSRANRIYSLVEDDGGRLWASGLLGVWFLDDQGKWQTFEAPHWLPSGIYSRFSFATDDGSLWFAVRGLGIRRYRNGLWTAYDSSRGLSSDGVKGVSVGKTGYLRFDLGAERADGYLPDRHAPETYIGTSAARGLGDQAPLPIRAIEGEPILFHFGGQDRLKDTPTEELRFAYRVDGGKWSPHLRRTLVVIRDLSVGEHVFEVRALDRDLNLDPTPATLQIEILRPWWSQPWVWLSFTLAFLAIGMAMRRTFKAISRERRAIAKEKSLLDQRRQFVRLASHELRKPLARMGHRAEMLSLPGALATPEKVAEYAEAIGADSRRLAKLVESLLTQAKVSEGLALERHRCDLFAIANEVIARTGEDVGARWQPPKCEASPVMVQADELYLSMAIRNLLDNGHKYGGGLDNVQVHVSSEGEDAVLTVTDNGGGVDEKDIARIFDPFQRGRTSPNIAGFGLGLSFARDIARAHGGNLNYRSADHGATFVLRIPLSDDKDRPS